MAQRTTILFAHVLYLSFIFSYFKIVEWALSLLTLWRCMFVVVCRNVTIQIAAVLGHFFCARVCLYWTTELKLLINQKNELNGKEQGENLKKIREKKYI